MKHIKRYSLLENYTLSIENENNGKLYSNIIFNQTVDDFYKIEDGEFIDYMEDKYNATFDFTGGIDSIKYTIYELEDDDNKFNEIMKEVFDFYSDPELWNSTRKYNL